MEMPNIKPISELRNYTAVVSEVGYGSRVYLTKNGHGNITLIDMKELDDIENELALYKFKYESFSFSIYVRGYDFKALSLIGSCNSGLISFF